MPKKNDLEKLEGYLKQFSPETIHQALVSLVFFPCPPCDRPIRVGRCTGRCSQVRRSIENLEIIDLKSTGDCRTDPQVLAESLVRLDWEYPWIDDQKCSDDCKCGAQGDGDEVDRYNESRAYDENIQPDCRLTFMATFTVVKRRRQGECRPV